MPMLHAGSEHDRAVSPIIAILLLLAITVVLTSVMYVTISQMIPNVSDDSRPLGVVVDKAGANWTIIIASVSAGVSPRFVYIAISDSNGTPILLYTPIADMTGYLDSEPMGTLSAGDRILIPIQDYPEGCLITIKDDQKLLFNGILQG